MRVTRIAFNGYQRLVNTACNTSGKMLAFVGPNEAGKTTVLRALQWFSSGSSLPARSHNKLNPPAPTSAVVSIEYWLEQRDLAAMGPLGLADIPTRYVRSKLANGKYNVKMTPPPARAASAFAAVRELFDQAVADDGSPTEEDPGPRLVNWSESILAMLDDPNGSWDEGWEEDFDLTVERLATIELDDLATDLGRVRGLLELGDPDASVRDILRPLIPEFALFSEADRDLKSSYDLSNDELRSNPPEALLNLVWVAGLDLEALWAAIEAGDSRDARTKERRANEQLSERLSSRWSQRDLNVEFNVNGNDLEVQIFEKSKDGAITPVDERSDGLRTFIAMVAFLARYDFAVPPVLLVDEAETHLHYDAQADLVEVLTKDVSATQVFYTTHSPGCLPRDLGTGIRLVEPARERSDESHLRNDFWSSDSPGFTPLLFAMGAGAAAFSAFRKAVLTEGAADMILLPTLLRLATGKEDLDFQVAPGIANYHGSGLELEEVAARVVYLVDGDQGGNDHRSRLLDMGIPEERIKQFPAPTAVEDYVDPSQYLDLVREYFASIGQKVVLATGDLDPQVSIAKGVEGWCKDRGLKAPGKTIIPARLVDDPSQIVLADGARERLTTLHAELMKALNARPAKRGR